jgi:hypothetical protein
MNILFIAAHGYYNLCKVTTYYDIIEYYKNNSKNDIKIFYTNFKKHSKICQLLNNWRPNLIIFFDVDTLRYAEKFKYLWNYNVPICASCTDFHWFDKVIKCKYINKCFALINQGGKTVKLLKKYKEYFPNKLITNYNSRYLNMNKFKNYNLEKRIDILIYGNRNPFYPLRCRLENLLSKNKNKYNLVILRKASNFYPRGYANEELSKLINKSYLTLTSCDAHYGDYSLLFDKYLEISASFSCPLGNIPEMYRDTFGNNMIEITMKMTDKEILNIIDKALSDKKKLLEMTDRIHNIVKSKFNLDEMVKDYDNVFEKILN